MKLRYVGPNFGAVSLTNGRVYIATIGDNDYYRVFDDSGEDYMYPRENPALAAGKGLIGKWEIVEEMDEREKQLDEAFKKATNSPSTTNLLRDESIKICEEYAIKYKKEIEIYSM